MSAALLDEDGVKHAPHDVTELGYTTRRCVACGSGRSPWPCSVAVQAWAADAERQSLGLVGRMTYEEKVAALVEAEGYDVEEARAALADMGEDDDDERALR